MEGKELQAVLSQAGEDHLGVALIQPGGSRYEQMKVAEQSATRVEPREIRPLQSEDCKGLFARVMSRGRMPRHQHSGSFEVAGKENL